MNLSLLQNFKENNFSLDPFPHIVIENALPEKLYKELADTYPINKFNHNNQNNGKLTMLSEQIQKDTEIYELWKKFVSFHKSKEFYHQVFDIFSKNISILQNFCKKMAILGRIIDSDGLDDKNNNYTIEK